MMVVCMPKGVYGSLGVGVDDDVMDVVFIPII